MGGGGGGGGGVCMGGWGGGAVNCLQIGEGKEAARAYTQRTRAG